MSRSTRDGISRPERAERGNGTRARQRAAAGPHGEQGAASRAGRTIVAAGLIGSATLSLPLTAALAMPGPATGPAPGPAILTAHDIFGPGTQFRGYTSALPASAYRRLPRAGVLDQRPRGGPPRTGPRSDVRPEDRDGTGGPQDLPIYRQTQRHLRQLRQLRPNAPQPPNAAPAPVVGTPAPAPVVGTPAPVPVTGTGTSAPAPIPAVDLPAQFAGTPAQPVATISAGAASLPQQFAVTGGTAGLSTDPGSPDGAGNITAGGSLSAAGSGTANAADLTGTPVQPAVATSDLPAGSYQVASLGFVPPPSADTAVTRSMGVPVAQDQLSPQGQILNQLVPDPRTPPVVDGIYPNQIPPDAGSIPGGTRIEAGGVTFNIPYDPAQPIQATVAPTVIGGVQVEPGQTLTLPPGSQLNLGSTSTYIPGNRDLLQLPDGTYYVGLPPAPGQPDTRTQVIIQTTPPSDTQSRGGSQAPGQQTPQGTPPAAPAPADQAPAPAAPAPVPADQAPAPAAPVPAPADQSQSPAAGPQTQVDPAPVAPSVDAGTQVTGPDTTVSGSPLVAAADPTAVSAAPAAPAPAPVSAGLGSVGPVASGGGGGFSGGGFSGGGSA